MFSGDDDTAKKPHEYGESVANAKVLQARRVSPLDSEFRSSRGRKRIHGICPGVQVTDEILLFAPATIL